MRRRIARASGLVAVLFGLLVGSNLFTADGIEGLEWLVIGGAAVLSLGGGVTFLYGLERGVRWMRLTGWVAYSLALLVPSGLMLLQLLAIAGGLAPGFGESHELRRTRVPS
ncbi:MAG: hypothetical protein ACLGHX_08520 [Acidimicrobiia bacterium]